MFISRLFSIILNHPIVFISKLSPKRVFRFFKFLHSNGPISTAQSIKLLVFDKKIPDYNLNIKLLNLYNDFINIKDYEPIVFQTTNNPLVSIIIPVFNHFNYTYNCLKSIHNNSGNKICYEIIIANDCSNDFTKDISTVIKNISVVTTLTNQGFIKNCNNAAKTVKGKYILLLNNDTQVQENWLLPLVELIEKNDTIGAVGSKLIFENGKLQEAGGILWQDASAWNYGYNNNPALPEYNYVKEVDYISGASLMIRKSVWDKLGGFDENFTPAYCEDSDICFSIRKLGYKVMFQPSSVVVHFEGVTNGKDIILGQKQYQNLNTKKLYKKWKNVLIKNHYQNAENVFFARDRSKNKKTILIIDKSVPKFDKDKKSKTIFQYLNLFLLFGFNIKFIDDSFLKHHPYTSTLEQLGIEVLYGNYYFHNWKYWLKENGFAIDFTFYFRSEIFNTYIDEVKKNTVSKIFYLNMV